MGNHQFNPESVGTGRLAEKVIPQVMPQQTHVANATGKSIYAYVGGQGSTIPAGSYAVFRTGWGRIPVTIYDSATNSTMATITIDSDRSVIVKDSGSGYTIVLARYGSIWQAE